MLRAGSSCNQALLCRAGFHTMVARHAHHFGHNWQNAELRANLVKRQPEFRPACHSCWFDVTDVAVDFRARRQIDAAAGFERFQRSEEHTSELQSLAYLVCRLLLEKKKKAAAFVSAQHEHRRCFSRV